MKTQDFAAMTVMALREECKNKSLTGYGKMTKDQLVELLSAHKPASKVESVKEEVEKPSDEKIWTDRHMTPLEKGVRVNARINARWFQGTVVNFKEIEGEEHVSVLLDGKEISKLFHSTDVEILVGMKSGKVDKVPEVPEEPKEEIKAEENSITKEKNNKKSTSLPKASVNKSSGGEGVNGFKKTKYDDILSTYDIHGLKKDDVVSFKPFSKEEKEITGILKSFIWDKQGNCPYFFIMVGDKGFYKKIDSVKKV